MPRSILEILESERAMRRDAPVLYWVAQAVLFVEQPGRFLRVWAWRIGLF